MSTVKVRSLYHSPKGEKWYKIGGWIVGWTFVLGLFYNWKVLKYNFSHEEVWVADEQGYFDRIENYGEGAREQYFYDQCFSSTTRGDANGVRFAPAQDVLGNHPDRWKYIEWECEEERFEAVMGRAKLEIGKKYDFNGVKGFVNPFAKQKRDKWYCSEICDWFKWLCGIYSRHQEKVSPRRSAYLLAKKTGREPQPLVKEKR